MSTEISRRDFIKFVFGTASAAAISGSLPLWPTDAMARPTAEPIKLIVDEYNYLVDPYFDFNPNLPTFREFFSLEGLSKRSLKEALEEHHWRFEHLLKDPSNWSLNEVEEWLDTEIQFDDMSPRYAAEYTEYADGVRLYESLPWEETLKMNLHLVEGPHPGSDFCGVYFDGDLDEFNKDLAQYGINLIVAEA